MSKLTPNIGNSSPLLLSVGICLLIGACSPVQFEFQPSDQGPAITGETSSSSVPDTDSNSANVLYGSTHIEDTRVRMLDRLGLKSVLDTLFGPSIVSVTTALIQNHPSQFGGSCDPANRVSEPAGSDCLSASGLSQASVIPGSSSSRASYMTRACDLIASTDSAILFAGQTILKTLSAQVQTPPTIDQIQAMGQQFTPGIGLTSEQVNSIEGITHEVQSAGLTPFEAWRFTYLVLCLSPNWQIL